MAKLGQNLGGIPAIYRANAIALIVFGAVHHHRIHNPEASVKQTIKNVAQGLGLDLSEVDAIEVEFYRTQAHFKANGGI